jgi:O-acetyl-ADP-ribose deacetylase (regulator of RNase III)
MPILFISLHSEFIQMIRQHGFEAHEMRIEEYTPVRKTYYVSPANSLCFMDGGIDYALSRIVFPNIEPVVKKEVQQYGKTTLLGRKYLPIGSSMIVPYNNDKVLIVSPTMLLPQDVSSTENAYYATMAILYNILILNRESLSEIDILFTSLCCGYGKMPITTSIEQIRNGIRDYEEYNPIVVAPNIVVYEPNLLQQPPYYENSEWFPIRPTDITYI